MRRVADWHVPTLTKSLFTAGQQCPKLLWWKVHEPNAVELQPDIVLQDRFDHGAQVGALARDLFDGGALIGHFVSREERIAKTKTALEARKPIFEGTFESAGIQVRTDVLLPEGESGWRLIEVKSSSSLKDEHIPDAAVQAWVLRDNGIELTGVEIIHLNKEYRLCHPESIRRFAPQDKLREGSASLLVRADITEQVGHHISDIPDQIQRQLKVLDGDLPDHAIGIHCSQPYDCPFEKRCWPTNRDHISRLHSVGPVKAATYMEGGVHSLFDWKPKAGAKPSNQSNTIRRQIRSLTQNRVIVEPGLAVALEPFTGRLGFLDFETISRAVPVWPDMGPWHQAAAQFSYHEVADMASFVASAPEDRQFTHAEFLAEGPEDARPKLAEAMCEATKDAERVVMYTPFERTQIRALRKAVPSLDAELEALEMKLIDLHPVIQNNVFHPEFEGSFSLKYVLPALVPGMTYDDLVIVNGLVASVEIARLLFVAGRIPAADQQRVRKDLLAYCKRDTWATVSLLDKLYGLGRTGVDV
jgi:predicted RecB family nuclease